MNTLADLIEADAAALLPRVDFSPLTGKRVLITGGSGLVGIHLLATLKALGMNATAVVQGELLPYQKELLSGMTVMTGDLTDQSFCDTLPPTDFIIHAAGYATPGRFMKDPLRTIKINALTTGALLQKLSPSGKFLFVSSSEIYSGSPHIPYKETDIGTTRPDHPRACYIEGKRCGETIVNAFRAQGVDAKSARLSLAYGPGTRPGDQRVLNSLIEKGLRGGIELLDQGLAKRTYCYVSDAAEIMWQILLYGKESVYNLGGNSKTTIRELAQMIGDVLHVPVQSPKSTGGGVEGAPEDVWVDMSRVEQEFGKSTYVPLSEGLQKTITWQQGLYDV